MRDALGQKQAGEGFGARLDFGGGALGQQFAPVAAGGRPEVDNTIGALHQLVVVLDHQKGVTFVAQGEQGFNEAVVVAGVQPDGRFVEYVEYAGEVGAELRS